MKLGHPDIFINVSKLILTHTITLKEDKYNRIKANDYSNINSDLKIFECMYDFNFNFISISWSVLSV